MLGNSSSSFAVLESIFGSKTLANNNLPAFNFSPPSIYKLFIFDTIVLT